MQFEELHISTIVESPFNYRKTFSPVALQELADTIKQVGIQQPVKVRHMAADQGDLTGKYELVFGARRFRAAQLAGLEFVPALIDDGLTDEQIRVIQLIENIQREDVNLIEEAEGLRELRQAGVPVEQITKETGKKKSHVYATISLTKLAGKARDAAAQGLIDREVAVLLASVPQALQDKALTLATKTVEGQIQKLPYRDAKAAIGQQLMVKLANAPFDIEAEGLDGRVSCGDCARRAGNDEGLIGELDENTCLDTVCYRKKVEAHVIVIATEHRAKGGTVLQGDEARQVNPWHDIYRQHSELTEELLDEPGRTLTIAEGLQQMADAGVTPPTPVLLIKEDGTHRQLLTDTDLLTLQNWMAQQSGAASDDDSDQADEDDGSAAPRSSLYHKPTFSNAQRNFATPGHRYATEHSPSLRRLIRSAALKTERTGEEARWILGTALEQTPEIDDDLMQHFGWDAEIDALPPADQPDEQDRGDWIAEHKLQTLSLDDCARILVYIGLENAPWGYPSQDAYANRFIEMADAYGIDVQALAAQQYDKSTAQQGGVNDLFDDADADEEDQPTDADQPAD